MVLVLASSPLALLDSRPWHSAFQKDVMPSCQPPLYHMGCTSTSPPAAISAPWAKRRLSGASPSPVISTPRKPSPVRGRFFSPGTARQLPNTSKPWKP